MKKPKFKYHIFIIESGWGCYATAGDTTLKEIRKKYVGDTWAVSESQAINNYCYREGVRAFEEIGDCEKQGELFIEVIAEKA